MKLNLIGGNKEGIRIAIDHELSVNCYAIQRNGGVVQVGVMGSALFSTIAGSARGSIRMAGITYAVFGTTLYRVNADGSNTNLGTISGSGRVYLATDQANIVIVTGYGNPGYVYNGTALAQITDPDFPGADRVNFAGGYFTFSHAGGWFISEVNAITFNALDFVGRSGETDILAQVDDHGEIVNFHADIIKVWINTGNSDFPFELNGAAIIERGVYSGDSVVQEDNTVFFLGNDLITYRMEGYTPVMLGDEGISSALANYLQQGYETNLRSAYGYTYTDHGHKFYVLTIPDVATHVINIATGLSHKLKHWDYETSNAHSYQFCYGKHLIFGLDGNVYQQSRNYYDDAGDTLLITRRMTATSLDDALVNWKSVRLIFDTGHGLATRQGSDPKIMLRWYDDDGRTPRAERQLSIGQMGEYRKSVKTTGLGRSRRRIFEISQSDPVPFALLDAQAVVT
jgi:hypothetical protein